MKQLQTIRSGEVEELAWRLFMLEELILLVGRIYVGVLDMNTKSKSALQSAMTNKVVKP